MIMPTISCAEHHIYTGSPNNHHLHAVMDNMVSQDGAIADSDNSPYKHNNRGCWIGALEEDVLCTGLMSTRPDQSPKRSNLRSVTGVATPCWRPYSRQHRIKNVNLRVWAHSSSSEASSPVSPASASSASASSSPPHHKTESRRWSFKRVFFKKGAISPSKDVDLDEHDCAFNHAVANMLDERSHREIRLFNDENVESPRRSSMSSSSSTMKKREKDQDRRKSSAPISPAAVVHLTCKIRTFTKYGRCAN
ncbi:hypothetical protein GOP47_0028874 [Adiantum capillus-veneris]|nr:hypothetical protein GOP47_0028874 [Adiantum capillus-veneris]